MRRAISIAMLLAATACSGGESGNLVEANLATKGDIPAVAATPPPVIVAKSSVGQGRCANGQNYWYQARRHADGSLCTNFQNSLFAEVPKDWDPKWNPEARKHYCYDSARSSCFIP